MCCLLFGVFLFVVRCLRVLVRCVLSVVCCMLFVMRFFLDCVCCLLRVILCLLCVRRIRNGLSADV